MLRQTGVTVSAWPHFASLQSPNHSPRHKESRSVYWLPNQVCLSVRCDVVCGSAQMGLQCALQEFPCQSMSGKWIGLIHGQHLQIFLESNSFKQQVTKLVSNQLAWGCNTLLTRFEQQLVSCLECYVSASMLQDMPFFGLHSALSLLTGDKYPCQLSKITTQNIGRWAQFQGYFKSLIRKLIHTSRRWQRSGNPIMGSCNDLFGPNNLVTGKILFVTFRLAFWV